MWRPLVWSYFVLTTNCALDSLIVDINPNLFVFSIWQNVDPSVAKLFYSWASFHCCRWANTLKQFSHLVTLQGIHFPYFRYFPRLRFVYTTTKMRRFRISFGHFISNENFFRFIKPASLTQKRRVFVIV